MAAYITYSPFLGPASYDSSFFLQQRLRLNAKRLFLSFLSIARTHSSRAQKGLKVANEQTNGQTYERTTYVGFSLSDSLSLFTLSPSVLRRKCICTPCTSLVSEFAFFISLFAWVEKQVGENEFSSKEIAKDNHFSLLFLGLTPHFGINSWTASRSQSFYGYSFVSMSCHLFYERERERERER